MSNSSQVRNEVDPLNGWLGSHPGTATSSTHNGWSRLRVGIKTYRATLAGLTAAAIAAWLACPIPPSRLFTPGRAIRASFIYLLLVVAACAVAAFIAEQNPNHRGPRIRFLTATAIWFAPVAILLAPRSTFVISLSSLSTLEAIAVLLIPASLWWLDRPPAPPDLAYSDGMFALPHTTRLMRQLPLSIGLALLAELIAIVIISGDVFVALLLAFAAAVLFVRVRKQHRKDPALTALMTMLAMMLAIVGIGRFVVFPQNRSGAQNASERTGDSRSTRPAQTESGTGNGLDGWTGVILIPEPKKHVTLVPPLPAMRSDVFRKPDDNPLTIPFFGVYWFYRSPASRPPPNSATVHGSPEDIRFRSQGREPLKMEAHQNLGKLIDISCCSRIQVAIHNAERSAEQSSIQLILANTTGRGQPPEYLSPQPLDGSEYQTLDFPIRANVHLLQFDELTVRIFRGRTQSQLSARISVERFTLVPRGR